ncbi:hypothetical protein SAY87_010322 [Trapa incisa]|uniref:Uncharacterized protein n=1 Tax=Trapa incisa TaxID=236973 RepID=A0AAN7JI19_9MYRT|nr:hypothetical protein SAY87_010322 [Trapa incisa]
MQQLLRPGSLPPLLASEINYSHFADHIRNRHCSCFRWAMEGIVRKYQQKFKRVREEMDRWEELQARLLSQYRNASSIIERLQVIQEAKNYGILSSVDGIGDAVVGKQMDSLLMILLSLNKIMEEFHGIVMSLEKIHRDSRQLVKGGSTQLTVKQLQQRLGVKPSLQDCLDGLMLLHDMHNSEYLLKSSIISALPTVVSRPSSTDLGSLQQLLVDQPNIPKEDVEFIFDIIFAEDMC